MKFTHHGMYATLVGFSRVSLEGYWIDYVPMDHSDVLFVTFENADGSRTQEDRPPWGMRVLRSMGCHVVGVKARKSDWYRGADLHQFFRSDDWRTFLTRFRRVVFYGSSMGGYAALTFVATCPCADVLAINPQTSLDSGKVPWETRYPNGRAQNWQGDFADAADGCRAANQAFVVYDPLHDLDARQVSRLNHDNIVRLRAPLLGHSLPNWLLQMGILKDLVKHVATGDLSVHQWSVMARQRRHIARYYTTMAQLTRSSRIAQQCIAHALTLPTLTPNLRIEALVACKRHGLINLVAPILQPADTQNHLALKQKTLAWLNQLIEQKRIPTARKLWQVVKKQWPQEQALRSFRSRLSPPT